MSRRNQVIVEIHGLLCDQEIGWLSIKKIADDNGHKDLAAFAASAARSVVARQSEILKLLTPNNEQN